MDYRSLTWDLKRAINLSRNIASWSSPLLLNQDTLFFIVTPGFHTHEIFFSPSSTKFAIPKPNTTSTAPQSAGTTQSSAPWLEHLCSAPRHPWWFWAPRYPWWSYPPWHLGSHSEPRHTLTWIPPPHPCISDFSLDWCYLTLSLAIKNEGISNDTDLEVIMTIQWYHNTSRRETSTWFLTNIEWRSVTAKATSSRHHLVKETAAWYHLTPYCLLTAYRQKFWHWYLPMRVLNENIKRIFSFRNDFG